MFTKQGFYEVKLKWKDKWRKFYVPADSEYSALNAAVKLLSESLGMAYYPCRNKYHGQRDNFTVTKLEV